MLFFKDLIKEKLEDESFNIIFKNECHICKNTIRLVARLEEDVHALSKLFSKKIISRIEYTDLKEGDKCDPKTVLKLLNDLGLDGEDLKKNCPKLKKAR